MPDTRTRDTYPYAVFVLTQGCRETPGGWGDAVWTGDAGGHDEAFDAADLMPPRRDYAPLRVLTVCMCDDGPPTMIEHKLSRNVERVA